MGRQLRVLFLFGRIVAWPIVRGLLRFLFLWVMFIAWILIVGIVVSIVSAAVNSDSPLALGIAGLLAELIVFVGGVVILAAYLRKLLT